jgi:hypothetical protein
MQKPVGDKRGLDKRPLAQRPATFVYHIPRSETGAIIELTGRAGDNAGTMPSSRGPAFSIVWEKNNPPARAGWSTAALQRRVELILGNR